MENINNNKKNVTLPSKLFFLLIDLKEQYKKWFNPKPYNDKSTSSILSCPKYNIK